MNAEKLNADAVVGISIDFETESGSYFIISVTGTAVKIVYNSKKGNNY